MPELTEFNRVIKYNPLSGKFTWLEIKRRWKCKTQKEAGYVNSRGYRIIGYKGKLYRAHRLAWFVSHGEIDSFLEVDHIDGDTDNNKISNLRIVDTKNNAMNRKLPKTSTSGVLGVYWHKRQLKWNVGIKINGKQIYLGSYISIIDAENARLEANIKYNFHPNHGK